MTQTTSQEWLSPDQLAEWLGVPVRSIYSWIHEGTVPRSHKIGRHRRFRRADVEAWLAERADNPVPAA
jgi:excisionase family DNA binding protein